MRPEQEAIYRKVNPADIGRLEGKRNQVARDVYSWLCVGTDSTMSGLRRASPAQLAESLGWSIPSVKSALQNLHDIGLIVWSPEVSVAYTFTAKREPPQNERHCKGLKRDTSWCPPCAAKSQAIDDIGDRRDRVSDTVSDTVSHTSTQDAGSRMQEAESRNQDTPVADAPAPAKQTPEKDDKPDRLLAMWNELADKRMGKARGTDATMTKLRAACNRDKDLDVWRNRILWLNASRHHVGDNDRKWTADLLWMVNPNNADKIDTALSKLAPTLFGSGTHDLDARIAILKGAQRD